MYTVVFHLSQTLTLPLAYKQEFMNTCYTIYPIVFSLAEGHEGVKWELGFALFRLGKRDLSYWDWDLQSLKQ